MKLPLSRLELLVRKYLYWPICRTYSRTFIKDNPADRLLSIMCGLQFYAVQNFWPTFRNPTRFSEKLWSRMLYDRDPLLTLISDKLRVRDFVAKRIGESHLVPLLWQGSSPDDIPFADLPNRFVIKANHGCGFVKLVEDKKSVDQKQIKKLVGKWLKRNFAQDSYLGIAWGYKNIKPSIMIESFIGHGTKPPNDYKFWCFGGQVEFISVHIERTENQKVKHFDKDFQPHEYISPLDTGDGEFVQPENHEVMAHLAEKLACGFDFMRVDLYSEDNKIYFGELTPYPGGVSLTISPESQDKKLGKLWPGAGDY